MTTAPPPDRPTHVESWGMVQSAECFVRRPTTVDDIRAALEEGRRSGRKVGLRGTGNSYGDAALNSGGLLLDLAAMNRILEWDPAGGLMIAEPGVAIADMWKKIVGDGWWPPVVSGTMKTSLGGAAAMNIHGKNNFAAGTVGKHIRWFEMLLADGTIMKASREENADVFHAAIGGLGMLGCFTKLAIGMKKVGSGLVRVEPLAVRDFAHVVDMLLELEGKSDYLVGWHDAFGTGKSLGRGLVHRASHLAASEDAAPQESCRVDRQELPANFFFVIPKSWLWLGLWFFLNDPGMRLVNFAKYRSGLSHAKRGAYLQPHAAYHFLLDYVPNWKFAYKPGGLVQYQVFIPKAHAARVFGRLVTTARADGFTPYLLVTKRHHPDPFLLTHAVDGFSMAMDFRIAPRRFENFKRIARALDEIVCDAGGRFYFAKDSVMTPATLERSYPKENVAAFRALKARLDPESLFETDLWRRVFSAPPAPLS